MLFLGSSAVWRNTANTIVNPIIRNMNYSSADLMLARSCVDNQNFTDGPTPTMDLNLDCSGKQLSLPPFKSFLRLNYRRVMSYVLSEISSSSGVDHERESSRLNSLHRLIEELRTSFDLICDQDYNDFLKQCDRDKYSAKVNRASRVPAKHIGSQFILNWALIETSKYCLIRKLAPDNLTTNQFLTVLKEELVKPIKPYKLIYRLTFLRFLQYLDKLIVDRISDSSHRKHTLVVDTNVELFIDANKDILESWFFRNRQVSARAALILGDAAECWRCISLRLWNDMATKYSTANEHEQSQNCPDPNSSRISISQTLLSLDTKQWQSNFELLALCAKELGDIDLLHGIQSLVEFSGLLGDKWPLINLLSSNVNLNFSKTYTDFLELIGIDFDATQVDQLCLIEFLDACVELDRLEMQSDKIAWLQSSNMRFMYEQYLDSKTSKLSDPDKAKNKFARVKAWASTWTFEPQISTAPFETLKAYTNVSILTQMNNASRVDCDIADKFAMIDDIRNVIRLMSTGKSLLDLNDGSIDIEIFEEFLKLMLGDESGFRSSLGEGLKIRPDRQHHIAHRLLSDTRLIGVLTYNEPDQFQLTAAKFNIKKKNLDYASLLGSDLDKRESVNELVKFQNRIMLLEVDNDHLFQPNCEHLVWEICQTDGLNVDLKNRFLSKIFCRKLRRRPINDLSDLYEIFQSTLGKSGKQLEEVNSAPHLTIVDRILGAQNLSIETLSIIAKSLDANFNSAQSFNPELLNSAFRTDITLLSQVQEVSATSSKRNMITEAVVRILDKIKRHAADIDATNLAKFSSPIFIDCFINHALFDLRNSIISLITCQQFLPSIWVETLTKIIKRIAAIDPNSILFETIVNQLDWQFKLACYRVSPTHQISDASATLLQPHDESIESSSKPSLESCRTQLRFWNEIYKEMIDGKCEDWRRQLMATETFLKEIHRISYLPGEYIKILTQRMNRRLQQYLALFRKYADPQTGSIKNPKHVAECRSKFDTIYHQESRSIEVIINYMTRTSQQARSTCYDDDICTNLLSPIKELGGRLKGLSVYKDISIDKLESLVKSIVKTLSLCRARVIDINTNFGRKLFMEQISPILSRMESNSVIMPGYFLNSCSTGRNAQSQVAPVLIHKICQGVQMIVSKTAPKKLRFIGSDGISRSYLLKAHEDLRLDKKIMDLFGSINILLEGDKKTRDFKYSLQRYSVTPVSSRSGLIQWVEAPSLCSSYRTWFQSPNGRRVVGSLYKETCATLCPRQELDPQKHNCKPLAPNQTVDPFYQLLWAKIRNLPRTGAGGVQLATHYDQVARPNSSTTFQYRREFPPSVYEEVTERMVSVLPKELIAHQLWFDSPHSMGFYSRTREFIRSCAAISMAGYVIGLGDRHPDNILLDARTGRVTHIDYNVCFEVGHSLSIPEQVPFRLTQSMIHAFGFAGLEGGFKRSCERILDHMKENKSIILHHLDPVNLNFMIGIGATNTFTVVGGRTSEDGTLLGNIDPIKVAHHSGQPPGINADAAKPLRRAVSDLATVGKQRPTKCESDLILCSQEDEESAAASFELTKATNRKENPDALIELNIATSLAEDQSDNEPRLLLDQMLKGASQSSLDRSCLDIKTPAMISAARADTILKRIQSKLSGNDELLLSKMYDHRARSGNANPVVRSIGAGHANASSQLSAGENLNEDLILLVDEVQSTGDQVNALILEAISNKNKAAMFEGWSPWI